MEDPGKVGSDTFSLIPCSLPPEAWDAFTTVKEKERILKAAREKKLVTYRQVPIRLSADFSKETLQARRECQEILTVMKRGTYSQECFTSKSIV